MQMLPAHRAPHSSSHSFIQLLDQIKRWSEDPLHDHKITRESQHANTL